MTKIDCLIEVAKKLREAENTRASAARTGRSCYFIDMTIAHVCDSLDARSEITSEGRRRASSRGGS